jgi:hypothetical protein
MGNKFGPYLTGRGINFSTQKNATRGEFIGNVFRRCGEYAMYFGGTGLDIGIIANNIIEADADDTVGYGLYMAGTGNANTLIFGNRAMYGQSRMSNSPWFVQVQDSTVSMFDNKEGQDFNAAENALNTLLPGYGKVIYVDGSNGDNQNSGMTPGDPVLTMTEAITLADDGGKDVIIVLSYPSAGATGETWPISVTKKRLAIIGANGGGSNLADAYICPTGDTAAFDIADSHITLQNLQIGGGATAACITFDASGRWGLTVRDCQLGVIAGNTPQEGILSTVGQDCPHLLVEGCYFHGSSGAEGISGDHIHLHNATRGFIRNNVFNNIASAKHGIIVDGTGHAVSAINDNKFTTAVDEDGAAITLAAGIGNTMVSGNDANFGSAAAGNNLFQDDGADGTTAAHWCSNWIFSAAITVA